MTFIQVLTHPLFALLFATALSLFFYVRAKRIKRLSFDTHGATVISSDQLDIGEELSVAFNGNPVPRVNRVLIRFWNSGHETIRGSDIAAADPLRWEVPAEGKLLSSKIEKVSRSPIRVSIRESVHSNKQCLFLNFDFLDKGDGAIISVLHTAPSVGAGLMGTIQGIPGGIKNWIAAADIDAALRAKPRRSRIRRALNFCYRYGVFLGVTIFGIVALVGALLPEILLTYFPSLGEPDTTDMLVSGRINKSYLFVAVIFLLISFFSTLFWWYRPPASLVGGDAGTKKKKGSE